jgi:acetoin utilization deacetylase AcuC-like enzyme
MTIRNSRIHCYYNEKQVCESNDSMNYSKSPSKPKRMMKFLAEQDLLEHFEVNSEFELLKYEDLVLAHTEEYVNQFLQGTGNCESNNLMWSEEFRDSVLFNMSSFYAAIRNSIEKSEVISFSPSSGFHHALPDQGKGSCTFSGQVISSVKIFKELGLAGCYLDLDGHFGNSIEDSRSYVNCLDEAIPRGFNFNPCLTNADYFLQLQSFLLNMLEPAILNKKIHYVIWCHGADSHIEDQLGYQCTTEVWLRCSDFFWQWVKSIDIKIGRCLPVSCALFGGYRDDDLKSVLSLHMGDLVSCLNHTLQKNVSYLVEVKNRFRIENRHASKFSEGDVIWMKEDIDVSFFANGEKILEASNCQKWQWASENKIPAFRIVEFESNGRILTKKLYNWFAVSDNRGLAPVGFQIPTEDHFRFLKSNIPIANEVLSDPTGFLDYYGVDHFSNSFGYYWCNYENDIHNAVYLKTLGKSSELELGNAFKYFGFAVRCVKEIN